MSYIENTYEVFISYAHSDDDQGLISACVDKITSVYRKKTGIAPKIFIDRSDLITSDIWESKIYKGLEKSIILLLFVSPSYIRSNWCLKEYGVFDARESAYRDSISLPEHSGIIFPVLLHPLGRGRFNSKEELFKDSLLKRQFYDFSSQAFESSVRENNVVELVEQLIDSIDNVNRLIKIKGSPYTDSNKNEIVISDYGNKLMWSGAISEYEMEFEKATQYVKSLSVGGFSDWRLPSVEEVKTLIDEGNIPDNPQGSTYRACKINCVTVH